LESEAFNDSEMALFSECRPLCAQTVLDTADIVRDGDVSPIGEQTLRLFLGIRGKLLEVVR